MLKSLSGASIGALAIAIVTPAHAQAQQAPKPAGGIQAIIVTATKRTEDLQDVPLSVNAMGEQELDNLGVKTFDDYLAQLPNVTAGGSGPGQNTIYIRGLASTTPNLTTAGVAGLAPNVALYLDDQPISQPGRNLDVYAADLQRIEVLSGPQGTLFGASSQAGVVRLITNKPSLSGLDASFKGETSFTKHGAASYKAEGMINLPVTNNLALRAVVYLDHQGGYIDNVHGTRSVADSARFRPAGTVRYNGVPVSTGRAGFQAGADLSNVNFIQADNGGLVQDNFNGTEYAGFRASALWEFAPDWKLTIEHTRQSINSDGVFFVDPTLGMDNPSVQQFENNRLDDNFSNTSWTLEGRLAALDIVYTGAYTDRETTQRVDYTDYLFVGQYLPYYICDGSVTYPGAADPSGTCQAPNLYVNSKSDATVFTQEFRVNTPDDKRIRLTAGAFYSKSILKERNDFTYPGSVQAQPFGPFAPNYPFPGVYQSDPGPFPAGVIFRNDVKRTDEQFGLFGELSLDIVPDVLTITGGARYYDVKVDLAGTANGSFCNSGAATDQNAYGTNISDLYDGDGQYTFIGSCNPALRQTFTQGQSISDIMAAGLNASQAAQVFNALSAPDKARTKGTIFKGTITFTPTEDVMLYATYSEGFRPGLLNRPGGAQGPNGYTVPFALDTDTVQNYEFGWKTELLDRQLRFNASAFYVDIKRLQTTIFDPSIVNLFFSDNAANARIYGIEGDFTVAPYAMPGLTVAGAFSFLDTKITDVLLPTNDVHTGDSLAYAPAFQGNLRVRYEWDLGDTGMTAHVMPQVSHSSSKYTDIIDINRLKLAGYTTFNLSVGIDKDQWSLELYGQNLTDKRAEVAGTFVNDRPRITINRPLTVGLRASFKY
ncbi:TonB-dependent receptor [Novosphingobium sp. ZN18A2]|uniref:TonB-dependent receptor n=1 Tax=Novosphingobium sp. ZN18A2 TaxID=3079861 RepID=UPI0030CD8BB0